MSDVESVWHYTTADGLHSIVSRNVLWATSYRFMNDSKEPKYATSVLTEAASEVRKDLDPAHVPRFDRLMRFAARNGLEAFLLCAARKPDLLTVWRGYGSAVPYAIELDATVDLLPVEQDSASAHPSPPAGWEPEIVDEDDEGNPIFGQDPDAIQIEIQRWTAVQYKAKPARKRVERIAKLAAKQPNPLSEHLLPWMELGGIDLLQLKHPAFVDEREARTVFEVNPRWKFVKHRATRFGLTPYIEVSAADDDNQYASNDRFVTHPAKKLPIRAVHIGPSPLGEESVAALREFLEFNGYPDLPVLKSDTPFR
ncbi:hypothetical protein ASC66_11335 [Leifsonia sp. Root4]|uniref:hypothetical protein n=1 Tax=Leifsonia sp. Root4 TaxID=1736525 RepID=UPI0006FF9CD4|nr:hypothetical protein [Leifsonia sp. Root4]KQW05574.1 hypothetical protein ASC66_11335 [Leifsonia sp. Root4]